MTCKTFNIAKIPKYDGCQRRFALMVYKLFDKKSVGGVITRTNKSAIKGDVIDKLAELVNGYINTYQKTIKMKTVDLKSSIFILINKVMKKIVNLNPNFL